MHDSPAAPAKPGLFGICAAIGEDFGFNPEYLRAALVIAMLWNAAYVVAAYLAMGAVVAISRWIAPAARRRADKVSRIAPPAAPVHANEDAPVAVLAQAA